MHHGERRELVVVLVVEPRAHKVEEPEARPTGEREGVDHELLDGLVVLRVRLVVEDVDLAVPELE